jgi:monoamine oxidase
VLDDEQAHRGERSEPLGSIEARRLHWRYADMVWATEAYTLGAYASFNPPGVLTTLGAAVDGPLGNIHFAGAAYSPEWPGYMDGAIRSGAAAPAAVLAAL